MQFTPKTEEQLQAEQLCAEGNYPFTVLECEKTVSKSAKNAGKEMLKIKLNVHADDGFDYHIYDYVADWFMGYKLRHFFYSIGRGADYESGNINDPQRYVGAGGYCEVIIQDPKPGTSYGPKNSIKDYVTKDKVSSPVKQDAPKPAAAEDDNVPF